MKNYYFLEYKKEKAKLVCRLKVGKNCENSSLIKESGTKRTFLIFISSFYKI